MLKAVEERDKEVYHPLAHSPSSYSGWTESRKRQESETPPGSPTKVAKAQILEPPSSIFLGTFKGSWIRSRTARAPTRALMWDAGIRGSS